jgi:predicted nucleic acid-binding protein
LRLRYVLDTNVIIQMLLSPDGLASKIIRSMELDLSTPYEAVDELWEHRDDWSKKTDVSLEEFTSALGYYVKLVYPPYDREALFVASSAMEQIDADDAPFVALALVEGAAVWTYDRHFEKQKVVPVVTSADILEHSHEHPTLYMALEEEYWKHFRRKSLPKS